MYFSYLTISFLIIEFVVNNFSSRRRKIFLKHVPNIVSTGKVNKVGIVQ